MAQQIINVGSSPGDYTGDLLRNSQIKVNANFTELYNQKLSNNPTTYPLATLPLIGSEEAIIHDGTTWVKITWNNIKAQLKTYFDTIYQNILVSGTNIKTINGTSILGSGNLVVSGGGKRVQIISDCSSWQLNQNLFFVTTESANGVGWNSGNTLKSSQPGATSNAISLITNVFVTPIGISAYNSNLKKLVLEARHSYYRPNDRFLIGYYQKNSASPTTHINPTIIYDNIVSYGEANDGTYVVLNINSNILIPENAMIVYAIASNDATAVATANKFYCLTTQIILEEI